ncbi:ankyrin repeat and SOCS box protein 2 isoform X4 [Chanodichthys erythropterus]|uniref:ankyrin repeat and SOCS box protein 2 isoform X4 n=1 Tax=Chanodichthys erythropterus TaxID=933992 RepID=UPI00351F44F2
MTDYVAGSHTWSDILRGSGSGAMACPTLFSAGGWQAGLWVWSGAGDVLLTLEDGSIMAAAHVSMPGTRGTNLEFADYSLYSNLSDDELMQLAIERSLADGQSSGPRSENSNNPAALNMPTVPRQAPPTHRPQQQLEPAACPANPPRENTQGVCSVGHFVTGSGKRMVAYRRYDGTMQVVPEPEDVCRNNVEICEMLVKAGAKVNMPNMYGITPIFVAAQSGKVDALRLLLKNGADLNSQAADGATALYEACKNGHDEIVEFLLSQNADANKPGKTGLMPIHIAAQRGNDCKDLGRTLKNTRETNIVSMLIPATSKARVRRSGVSPLHLAAERNRNDILELLIEAGFDVNATLSDDRSMMYEDRRSTALYFAVMNNNIDATTMLLEAGANPNLDTFNPLLVALRQGCIQTVTMLVKHGANVNAYIPTHPTAFPAAVMFCMKHLTLLKYLMDNGCDALSCFNCVYGRNPHPPIKIRRNLRYDSDETVEKTCVQFCELISTETYSHWAGPIIDVLLDYVGHVKLCACLIEHLDSYDEWQCIKEKSTPPRPLMQLCRLKIRKLLGINRLKKICKLPVPPRLIKFLNHQEREIDF